MGACVCGVLAHFGLTRVWSRRLSSPPSTWGSWGVEQNQDGAQSQVFNNWPLPLLPLLACTCQCGENGTTLASPIPPPQEPVLSEPEGACPAQESSLGTVGIIHSPACPSYASTPPFHRKPCLCPPASQQGRICSFNNAGFSPAASLAAQSPLKILKIKTLIRNLFSHQSCLSDYEALVFSQPADWPWGSVTSEPELGTRGTGMWVLTGGKEAGQSEKDNKGRRWSEKKDNQQDGARGRWSERPLMKGGSLKSDTQAAWGGG